MKKLIMVVITVISLATLASAAIIQSTTDLTETEFDNLVSDNVVAARSIFRAGNSEFDIYVDNNDGVLLLSEKNNGVTWDLDGNNNITLGWDRDTSGNLDMEVNSLGTDFLISTHPTTWFDTILISLKSTDDYVLSVSLDNNIENENFGQLSATPYTWSGVRVDLNGYDENNQDPFDLSMDLDINMFFGQIPADDDFQGEVYFIQTGVVPEPATITLIAIGGLSTLIIRRARRPRF